MKYKKWNIAPPHPSALEVLTQAGIPPLAARILCARGVEDVEQAKSLLSREGAMGEDPFLMQDMDRAVARIQTALTEQEQIVVYGDYDVDGITSTCLLTEYLRNQGGQVISYIPDRLEEGYGLNRGAVERLAEAGIQLIITVDCGITAVDEVEYARSLGVDVVITDHHSCKSEMPKAVAVVDPQRPDCDYPFKALAGVGVALKLILALTPEEQRDQTLDYYVDLAAVGTVADVMSLTGENRSLVSMGLKKLERSHRKGFRALLKEVGVDRKGVDAGCIGYSLAPRLNAAGRMGCAMTAAELLLTQDGMQAEQIARTLCSLNRERQAIEGEIYTHCMNLLERERMATGSCIVLAGEQWHQGVVGIVASRLAEHFGCPTFMISLQDGQGKGSCRSAGGFNLFQALEHCAEYLEGFGGHAMAAGFTIAESKIEGFRQAMEAYVSQWSGGDELPTQIDIDCELDDLSILTVEEVNRLDLLEPCGAGNPKPVFVLSGCTLTALSEVGGGRHLKLRVARNGRSLDAIFFSTTASSAGVAVGERVDLAFTPQINDFRGHRSVQLLGCDIRHTATRVEAEQALYDRLHRGEPLSAYEAANLIPNRGEFAAVWRYLQGHAQRGQVESTARHLARNVAKTYGIKETVMRTMVCLDVLDEHGLIALEQSTDHLRISLQEVQGKVNLEDSALMQRLKLLASG